MMPCDHCQNELLPYVFDLLDQADRERLEQHLEGCDSCRSALVKVRSQQELLRKASKAKFPGVSFHAPAIAPALSTEPVNSETRNYWQLLALAASVLILLTLGSTAAWLTIRSDQIRNQLAVVREQEAATMQSHLNKTRQRINDELKEASRPDRLAADFFPEGGTLIAGVPNRVYFQIRTKEGAPAEFRGRVIEGGGQVVVADVRTTHIGGANLGLGQFAFTPQESAHYMLMKDGPLEGIGLPDAQSDGVALSLAGDTFKARGPIPVTLRNVGKERKLRVAAIAEGKVLDEKTITAGPKSATTVELHSNSPSGGVCRLTVSEADEAQAGQFTPVAERLFYVQAADELHLAFNPQVAGDKATLEIEAKGGNGQPRATVVSLSVVDASKGQLAEGKLALEERALGRNSKDLEDAIVLLAPDPKAAAALDLQLGANNWRDPQQSNDTLLALRGEEAAVRLELEQLDAGTHSSLNAPWGAESKGLEDRLAQLQSIANAMRPFAIIGLAIVALLLFAAFLWPFVRARWPKLGIGLALSGTLAAAAILMATFWNAGENLEKPKRPAMAMTSPPHANSAKEEPTANTPPAPTEEKSASQPLGRAGAKSSIAPIAPAPAQVENSPRNAPRSAAPEGLRSSGIGGAGPGGGIGGGIGGGGGRGFGGAPMIADTKKKEPTEKERISKDKGASLDRGLVAPGPAGIAGRSLQSAKPSAGAKPMTMKPAAPVSESELRDSAPSRGRELPVPSNGPGVSLGLQKNARDAKADSIGTDFFYRSVPKTDPDSRLLYWNPSVSLSAGKAEIPLDLPRSVSYIKITAEVRTPDGKVGTTVRTIAIQRADAKEPRTK